MVYIPQGSYNMGNADQDIPYTLTAPTKTVSVRSFFMDQTEITNNEYRQFVEWVRDSIVRFRLGEDGLVEGYEFIDYENIDDPSFYQEYISVNYPDSLKTHINWDATIEWNEERYPSAEYTEIIETIYLLPEELYGRKNGRCAATELCILLAEPSEGCTQETVSRTIMGTLMTTAWNSTIVITSRKARKCRQRVVHRKGSDQHLSGHLVLGA